jgi:hypothetical protein
MSIEEQRGRPGLCADQRCRCLNELCICHMQDRHDRPGEGVLFYARNGMNTQPHGTPPPIPPGFFRKRSQEEIARSDEEADRRAEAAERAGYYSDDDDFYDDSASPPAGEAAVCGPVTVTVSEGYEEDLRGFYARMNRPSGW